MGAQGLFEMPEDSGWGWVSAGRGGRSHLLSVNGEVITESEWMVARQPGGATLTKGEALCWLVENVTKWPKHCKTCSGLGYIEFLDDPIGEPWSSMQRFTESCGDCYNQGQCPRCGREAWPETAIEMMLNYTMPPLTCPHCGWNEENPDALPERPECY